MLHAVLLQLERGRQGEDRPPVLDGHHAPGREAAPVPAAIDVVDDGRFRIAGAQEVGVQRVDQATLDRLAGRQDRLGQDLPTEHARRPDVAACAPKQVDLERLKPHQVQQFLDRVL